MDETPRAQDAKNPQVTEDQRREPSPLDGSRTRFARIIGLLAIATAAFFAVAIVVGLVLCFTA